MPSNLQSASRTLTPFIADDADHDDEDDFQLPIKPPSFLSSKNPNNTKHPLPLRHGVHAAKKARQSALHGKENRHPRDCKKGDSNERRCLPACVAGLDSRAVKTLESAQGMGASSGTVKPFVLERTLACLEPNPCGKDGSCLLESVDRDGPVQISRGSERKGAVADEEASRVVEDSDNCLEIFENDEKKDLDRIENPLWPRCLTQGAEPYAGSIESRLLREGVVSFPWMEYPKENSSEDAEEEFDAGTQLNKLMNLCSELNDRENLNAIGVFSGGEDAVIGEDIENKVVDCPLCRSDITHLSEELRNAHTNACLDGDNDSTVNMMSISRNESTSTLHEGKDFFQVQKFLRSLELSRYEEAFIKEEIDWDTLQWLTEEDLMSIGVSALGPRKKIVHALNNLRKGSSDAHDVNSNGCRSLTEEKTKASPGNKLITEYFQGHFNNRGSVHNSSKSSGAMVHNKGSMQKRVSARNPVANAKLKDVPSWCCIPGTTFRVDAFRFLRGDCSHWFLTHFHLDHYQGLTKSFRHGKIYCSSITANLVNMKIGIPWERIHVLPLGEKIHIDGVGVTCLDANHCPGSIIIIFEPSNGKAVLHTGDFRFGEAMANCSVLNMCNIHTLILDTTYCNPQYDFPKQEAVIQFVIEAIQAEAFNPKTLFLIGSYTVGKERLFLEVARHLRKKVFVGAAKLRLLQCLGFPEEDMQWFTLNEMESDIHVVPMWTIASFRRMKTISNQYSGRYNLIVAFSPTGWTFGKGKKKSPGKRWQQGTVIRYEVPYSEHSSFSELQQFLHLISPEVIIPSVNNTGQESVDTMIALLTSASHPGRSS